MQDLSREAILRMIGLHDAAHLSRQLNAIQLSLEEENGKMVSYWTEIRKTEKEITLIAGRMDDAETDIAQLQVTEGQISASVSSLQTTVSGHTEQIASLTITTNSITQSVSSLTTTVNGHTSQISTLRTDLNGISATVTADHTTLGTHTTQIGSLQVTTNSITQSVSSLTTTVNGHTSQISTLRTDLNGISATVTADHTTLGTHTTQIGSLQVTTNSISQSVSNISDEVDAVSGTVTTHTSQISTLRTDLNGISATVTADHTTLGTHTTQIGSLQTTTSSISGRVTAIEGDYVKEAEISLMVKKDSNGYISNASIKADNIDFTFTRSTNFISNGTTVMNINSRGDLWIKGNLKGGNIQGNYTVGTTGNRMEIYVDEVHKGYITTSGLRGYDSNGNVLLDLRVLGTSVSDNSGYLYLYSSDGRYSILDIRSVSFTPSNGGGSLTFGYDSNGKVYIYAPKSSWPSLSGSTLVGQVYLDNGYLRVRTS